MTKSILKSLFIEKLFDFLHDKEGLFSSILISMTLHFLMVIIAALSIEIAPLLNALSAKKLESYSNKTALFRAGDHDGVVCGVGPVMAERTFRTYLKTHKPDHVLNIGTAGMLLETMELGKVYHISQCMTENEAPIRLNVLTDEAAESCLSVRRSINDSSIRVASHKTYAATLADMECYTLAAIAKEMHIPMSAIKVTTDFADCDTTEMFKKQVDESAKQLAKEVQKVLLTIK